MFTKSLKFISIISLTVLALGIFATPVGAVAPNILNINFENEPLFSNANIMPGDSVTRFVEVTNTDSATTYTIATKADNVINADGLGDVMNLTIFDHNNPSNIFYTSTLTDFFNAGAVELSALTPGQYIKYDYKIDFLASAGNDYQGKTLGFDIIVGDGDSETTGGESGGGGGGGGGGYTHHDLKITDEAISTVGSDFAIITWNTRDSATDNPIDATSRVIYDATSHPDLSGCSAPNYCYLSSNTEDSNKVFSHSMTITGLAPGTIYYFRPVSHASPEKTGIELTFTTLANNNQSPSTSSGGNSGGGTTPTITSTLPTSLPTSVSPPAGTVAGEQNSGNVLTETPSANPVSTEPQVKGANIDLSCFACPWWIWLIVILLHLLVVGVYILFVRYQLVNQSAETGDDKKSTRLYPGLFWSLTILPLIVIYLLLTFVCHFPEIILALTLISYLIILVVYHFIIINNKQQLWTFIPLLLAVGPIISYFYCGSWVWWLWLLMLIVYLASLWSYYFILKRNNHPNIWWLALILFSLLTIITEISFHLCLPCLP